MHKFLNDIGVSDDDFCVPGTKYKKHSRKLRKKFKKERKKYGFDSREVYSLDVTSSLWLYERLKMYLKCAKGNIDLDFHTFQVREVEIDPEIWNSNTFDELNACIRLSEPREMTQKEAILLCIKYLKAYIQTDRHQERAEKKYKKTCFLPMTVAETIDARKAQQAFRIYAEIFLAM